MVGRNNIANMKVNQFTERFCPAFTRGVRRAAVIGAYVPAPRYYDDFCNFKPSTCSQATL